MIYFEAIEPYSDQVDSNLLIAACRQAVCTILPGEERDMSLVITDDSAIQELNRQYREVDAPTDVLSFPANELDPETGVMYAGDVMISYPTASRQAELNGNNLSSELALLAVHGSLHLLGFDHGNDEEKNQMWTAQKQILDSLGITLNQYPE
jgi:probable rRNA maturation factor